jgi:uncharacterized PurR-regulated membrane protein YhhQ (DUF165 family)
MDDRQALARRRFRNDYVWFASLFAVVMVLTNVIGTKLFALFPGLLPQGFGPITGYGPVILTTGIVTYPLTFLFTDLVSEIWGKTAANRLVFIGFIASILMLVVIQFGVRVTPADRYWTDPSGNLIGQQRVVAAAAAGADRLVIDSGEQLVPQGSADLSPQLALHEADGWRVLEYEAVESSGGFGGGWHHHAVRLSQPLQAPVAAGTVIAQVATLWLLDPETGAAKLDRPAGFPINGRLSLADGTSYHYGGRLDDGRLTLHGFDPSALSAADRSALEDGGLAAISISTLPPGGMQLAYEATFASPGTLLLASMCAYLVAQLLDVLLYHFWRNLTQGRHLWLRNNGSTMVSQLVDTIIVNGIFLPLAFGMGFAATAKVILAVYLCKLALAALDTPLIYAGVWLVKRRFGLAFTEEIPYWLSAD